MKTFRELYIHLNGVDIDTFYEKLEQSAKAPWVHKERGGIEEKSTCFEALKGLPATPPVKLFIFPRDSGILRVSNIIPAKTGWLTYDQYNAALEHFHENIVCPAITGTDIKADLTSDQISIGSIAGDNVEEAFVRFSNSANKSTGSSHPCDRERWLDFVLLAHKAKSNTDPNKPDLDSDIVIRSLVDLGWSEETALKLGIEFELAEDILSHAQRRNGTNHAHQLR